jgi:Contractile injection system tube protein/LysM domain
MPSGSGFQQAKLEIEGGTMLDCWFNPSQYSISKANEWTTRPVVGSSLPHAQFGGGHARELTVDLLFDAHPDGDVTAATDQLFQMMEVDPSLASGRRNQARPPTLKLSWGTFMSFKAVCRHLDVQFTAFRADGTATRAHASLRLVQVEKDQRSGRGTVARPQNPTSRNDERMRSHLVCLGDSLQSIAFEHYGDAARWPTIAEHNGIDNPLVLRRGMKLTIPLEAE